MFVIGIDSSTQSTKAEVRAIDSGEVVATGKASHPPTSPPVSEQDPRAWMDAMSSAIEQLGDERNDVVAIAVAGQQHGLVLLDADDEPVRPAKLWNDTTSSPQSERLISELGADWWATAAGVVPVAAFTITKLAWVAEHEPDLLARATKVMLPHDYLTYRLTGNHVTDRGDASGTGWYDATTGATLTEPLAAATGDATWTDRVPTVLGPRDAAGTILPEVAAQLGLPDSVIVGPGTGDNMGAGLGLGLEQGDMVVSLGTSGTAYARTARRAADASGAVAGFSDAAGGYLPLVCTLNATKVTDTIARLLGTDAAGLSELAMQAGTDVSEATLVPYFDGERTPNRPDARGMVVGMNNDLSREEMARVAHDGVVCGLLDGVDALVEQGASTDGRLYLVGGGARSEAYRNRLATIVGRQVFVPDNEEAVVVGAAIQAASLTGEDTVDEIAKRWNVRSASATDPTPDSHGAEIRERYAAASGFDDALCRPLI